MNKEIIKAMEKKNKSFLNNLKKWWNKNDYKVFRVILFPIFIISILYEKYKEKIRKRNPWNEERAKEILNYYIPRSSEWSDEEKDFYYFNNGYGWNMYFAKKYLKIKDRNFWEYNKRQMREYLIKKFELEGFIKTIGDCSDDWTELYFSLIEEKEK